MNIVEQHLQVPVGTLQNGESLLFGSRKKKSLPERYIWCKTISGHLDKYLRKKLLMTTSSPANILVRTILILLIRIHIL